MVMLALKTLQSLTKRARLGRKLPAAYVRSFAVCYPERTVHSRPMSLKNSVFSFDHNLQAAGQVFSADSRSTSLAFKTAAQTDLDRSEITTERRSPSQPEKPEFSRVLENRVFQHNRPVPAVKQPDGIAPISAAQSNRCAAPKRTCRATDAHVVKGGHRLLAAVP